VSSLSVIRLLENCLVASFLDSLLDLNGLLIVAFLLA